MPLGKRSQSAMEYLMTYGWAILIIAVVLGALYSLGVFNAVNFAPKVPGGGCHVFRPNGPGTSWNVNLVGSCNNALPQYVAQFNGQSSGISVSNFYIGNSITVSFWIAGKSYNNVIPFSENTSTYGSGPNVYGSGGSINWNIGDGNSNPFTNSTYPDANWHNIVVTSSSALNIAKLYIDGLFVGSASYRNSLMTGNIITIGRFAKSGSYFLKGSMADVQVYNTSLSANQVQYLYNEGIGGVPISPQYLAGWWPLNGDANDYSGNNNNGAATAITFNGTWTGGYNIP